MVNISLNAIIPALVGGLLIGIATSLHLFLQGKITGMSGIFYGALKIDEGFVWKSSLLSGLVLTSCIAYYIFGFEEITQDFVLFDSPNLFKSRLGSITLVLAGLLVGVGTKIANGCTSGHGVCGLPRFSLRSFVAVLVFMGVGMGTANFTHYVIYGNEEVVPKGGDVSILPVHIALSVSSVILLLNFVLSINNGIKGFLDVLVSFIVGVIFAMGLLVSGMSRRSKVLGFLTFSGSWDISLMFVMGGAVMLNLFTFHHIIKIKKKPVRAEKFDISTAKLDWGIPIGAYVFGLGWGLGGICPGPAILVTPIYFSSMIQFMLAMAGGQHLTAFVIEQINSSHRNDSSKILIGE